MEQRKRKLFKMNGKVVQLKLIILNKWAFRAFSKISFVEIHRVIFSIEIAIAVMAEEKKIENKLHSWCIYIWLCVCVVLTYG